MNPENNKEKKEREKKRSLEPYHHAPINTRRTIKKASCDTFNTNVEAII
jgi:hypothetical protein